MTKIKKCTCKHEYQDQKYGGGMRVHNRVNKSNNDLYRCTVCGKEK